jgi:hypothetical protein
VTDDTDLPENPTETDDVPEVDEDNIPIEPDVPSDIPAHPTETDDPDALPYEEPLQLAEEPGE